MKKKDENVNVDELKDKENIPDVPEDGENEDDNSSNLPAEVTYKDIRVMDAFKAIGYQAKVKAGNFVTKAKPKVIKAAKLTAGMLVAAAIVDKVTDGAISGVLIGGETEVPDTEYVPSERIDGYSDSESAYDGTDGVSDVTGSETTAE